jgi:hypothetical protein
MLLAVTFMTNSTTIELRQGGSGWAAAETAGVTNAGCAVVVPPAFNYAEFEVRATSPASRSDGDGTAPAPALAVNRPSAWFAFGDRGDTATAGGWLRIVGEAISLERPSALALRQHGQPPHTIAARAAPDGGSIGAKPTRWHAFYDIPAALPPGTYEVALRGYTAAAVVAEKLCTFTSVHTPCLSTINITASAPFPSSSKVFTVKAQQPGVGRNATAAVLGALAEARASGGGTVFFPRGQYFIDTPIIVPDNTVIKGEGQALVSIYFAESTCPCDLVEWARLYTANHSLYGKNFTKCLQGCTAPLAYITSDLTKNKTGHPIVGFQPSWGIEDLAVYVTSYAKNVVQFQPQSDGCFVRRVTIRFNSQLSHNPGDHGKPGRGGRTANWNAGTGQAVTLAGR